MTEIKPAIQRAAAIQSTAPDLKQRSLRRQDILLLTLASILIHGLGLLLFSKFQPDKFAGSEDATGKPIDFVVLPPTGENKKPPTKKPPAEKPPEESASAKNPEPEITTQAELTPTPAEPEASPEPTPAPAPTSTQAVKPAPLLEELPEVLSGSEQNQVTIPEPEKTSAPENVKPEVIKPEAIKPDPVATSLPPAKPTEPLPKADPEVSPEKKPETTPPTNSPPETDNIPSDSAASLLGGDYKKTFAENGTDAFFSPEALEYQAVLDTEQLQALKGFDLKGYQKRLYEKVKRNWQPSFRQKYTTWLTFNIQKNGQISNLQIIESSGSTDFDQIALEAVQNAAPLEALPLDFPLEQLEFKYQFYLY